MTAVGGQIYVDKGNLVTRARQPLSQPSQLRALPAPPGPGQLLKVPTISPLDAPG